MENLNVPKSAIRPVVELVGDIVIGAIPADLALHQLTETPVSPDLHQAIADHLGVAGQFVEQYPVPLAILFGGSAIINGVKAASRLRRRNDPRLIQ